MSVSLAAFLYLISGICFIMALRGLSPGLPDGCGSDRISPDYA